MAGWEYKVTRYSGKLVRELADGGETVAVPGTAGNGPANRNWQPFAVMPARVYTGRDVGGYFMWWKRFVP